MENENEISSSTLSFASLPSLPSPEPEANTEFFCLSKLSSGLENLLIDPNYKVYTDADVVVESTPVGVHRCLLAVRSPFFHEVFSKGNGGSGAREARPRYLMSDLVGHIHGHVGREAFDVILKYIYTGKLKPSPPEVSTCVDECCTHDACRPAIDYAVELMYASATFQIEELVMLVQRHLFGLIEKAPAEDVIPILLVAFRCHLKQLFSYCVQRIRRSDLDRVTLRKEIPHEVLAETELVLNEGDSDQEKQIKNIRRALDSDDVELVKLLLRESSVTLDDAYALHYAAAYCDPKVFKKVLDLQLADLNLTDSRGRTVLHVAARRKEPGILLPLLNKGACALQTTADGLTAVSICRRLTRPKDYKHATEMGKESNKEKLCIDALENEMLNVSTPGMRSVLSEVTAANLHELEYLENRVQMAWMLFPREAKVAMETAEAEWTPIYKGLTSKGSVRNVKDDDPNETSSMSAQKVQLKLQALRRTVEIGQRYFPNCSEEIVKFLDDVDVFFLEKGTEEEQRLKRKRYMELKEDVKMAFRRDIAEKGGSAFPSSSSSSSSSSSVPKDRMRNKIRLK